MEFASFSSVGYANEGLRRSTKVFAFVTSLLVGFSRRKLRPAISWLRFRTAMLKYGRRSRVEFPIFFCVRRPGIRNDVMHAAVQKNVGAP